MKKSSSLDFEKSGILILHCTGDVSLHQFDQFEENDIRQTDRQECLKRFISSC